jgi:hypothetical protein
MSNADDASDGRKAMQALREAVTVGVGASESLVQLHQHTSCNICYVRQHNSSRLQRKLASTTDRGACKLEETHGDSLSVTSRPCPLRLLAAAAAAVLFLRVGCCDCTPALCCVAQDTLSVALSLPCFHSFCSLCIRRCLHLNASCPLCHAPASSGELRPNFALTQIAQLVHHLDAEVQRSVQRHVEKWARGYLPHIATDEASANEDMAAPRTEAAALNNRSNAAAAAAGSASVAAVSTSAAAAVSSTGAAINSSSSALPSATAKVECPCCGLSIVAARINRHLDACLGKEDNQKAASDAAAAAAAAASASASSSAASASSNARLPFPVYNMLSEKQLRKLLADLGFPSGAGGGGAGGGSAAGLDHSREALVRRHREFVLRHNSELDASGCGLRAAQSDAALVKDIVRKERARNTHTQGRQAKQSLLNAFASPNNNDPPAAAGAASLPQPLAATVDVEGSHALSGAGTASARKRNKRTPSAAAATSTAPLKSPRRLTNSTPAILDLSSDDINPDDPSAEMRDKAAIPAPTAAALTSSRSLRSRAPSTAEHAAATAAAVPPVGASTAAAAASATSAVPASSSSSSDPYASLIASYEAKHGPRRRWKRRWGLDDTLYPKKETIELLGDESPVAPAAAVATVNATGALATASSDAPVPVAAAASSSSSPKAVFSLFQPATAAAPSHPTSTSSSPTGATIVAAAAAAPSPAAMNASGGNGGVGSSSSSNSSNRSGGSSHGSGVVRVSKVLCSNCRATCRGNFPLGASVMCPKCRPAWTSKLPPAATAAASNQGTHDDTAPPAPLKPTGWMAKAQQQQQQQQRSASTPLIPPAPADSVATIVPAASPASVSSAPPPLSSSSSSSSIAAAGLVLSAAQQSAIEERRTAALAKLRHKPRMTDSIPAETTAAATPTASNSDQSNKNDHITAPDAERGAVPMQVEEEKTAPQAHSL